MYFKIPKGTGTFQKLTALHKRMLAADRAAYKLVQELRAELGLPSKGRDHRYAASQGTLAGGIAALLLDAKPEGWKMVGLPHQKFFFPKMNNKPLLARIKALPVLSVRELNDIVGYKGNISIDDDGNFVRHRGPGMEWKLDVILMETAPGAKYTPPNSDIVEILESEYRKLSKGK